MIDITPRETNYTSTMAGSDTYGRQPNSPGSHSSSAYARDRELNDAEGKNIELIILFTSILGVSVEKQGTIQFKFTAHLPFEFCTVLSFMWHFFFVFSCLSLSFSFELIQRICDLCVIRAYCFAANCTSPIYLHNRLRLKIVYIKYAGGRCDSISFSLSISLFHSVSLTLTHLDELLCWIFFI